MADGSGKYSENVPGKYYVTQECIGCGACAEEAPDNFSASEDGTFYYVSKQPENSTEEDKVRAAMESCPAEAIFDDGD